MRRILETIQDIPRGCVANYGQIAEIAGIPRGARQVGYAMAATPSGQGIPWHRVINSKGEISARKEGHGDSFQRQKLIEEGVLFDARGRVDFDRFGWIEAEFPFLPEDWFDE